MYTCSECKFFKADKDRWIKKVGHCYRYPPVIVMQRWKSENGWASNEVMRVDELRYARPETSASSFCGEFSPT